MERMTARVLRAPFTGRAARELLFCALGLVFGLAVFVIPPAFIALSFAVGGSVRGGGPAPAAIPAVLVVDLLVLAAVVLAAPLVGRWLGAVHRFFAAWLLGERIAPPATPWRLRASLADGPGWRAAAYSLIKVPLGILEGYGPFCWVAGIVAISYPLWWGLFRNHPPGVTLSPVPVITPLGTFQVSTFAGTFAALAAGVAMLLAAPWLARGASTLDRAVMRRLLGPGRVQQLLATRTRAVDDAAATLRRLERDLHDGAQIRLATVAMNLGMATEKLGSTGTPPDLDQARDLVDTAHRGAKEALTDLRNLIRGIHPPVLDSGLGDALATLAAGSPIPTTLTVDLPTRPTPAIETIAYFCASELLANAAKHSDARHIAMSLRQRGETVRLEVRDDGVGGAVLYSAGTGLAGLADRVSTVDGRIDVSSPPGGPTRVTVELPLRA
jgi:signal transduction histidine kinase